MKDLLNYVKAHSDEFGSIPFWSWNDKLDPEILIKQIDDMKKIGMKGFFMHARSGLETEYLSDEWYDCIKACVEHAKKLDMQAWAYDENGWPSGFAGGKLLNDESNFALYLTYQLKSDFDPDAFAVYTVIDNKCSRVTAKVDGVNEYHCVYRNADDSYVDTMDANITRKFIAATHEDYKKRLGDDFGTAMPGFFTDEPQYYRYKTPWSDTFPVEFEKCFGYDVMSALAALFIDFEEAREFRYDYHLLCHKLFLNNWIKVIYEWGQENGSMVTGHFIEERILFGQMWCCGGIMPFYEYMDIPGVDFLCKGVDNDISHKQIGSVAAQLGKKRVLSEMFAACGWEVTPLELKRIAEHQYFGGVNLMCQHLYPYSLRGQRKRDYPCHYSEHLGWQSEMAYFNEYFNRLGCTLAQGEEYANVLVIHPIHSAYLDYKREIDLQSMLEIENSFRELTEYLSQHQIPYHYGDELLMAKYGSVDGNKFIIGNCKYDTVVLPLLYTIDSKTAELLHKFIDNGGKVVNFADTLPDRIDGRVSDLAWLIPNTDLSDLTDHRVITASKNGDNAPTIRIMQRIVNDKRMFYILNVDKRPCGKIEFTVNNASALSILDIDRLEFKGIPGKVTPEGSFVFELDFEAVQSYVVCETEAPVEHKKENININIKNIKPLSLPENAMPLDYVSISFDGVNWQKKSPFMQIKDNLLSMRYKGDLWLLFEFEVNEVPDSLNVVYEPINYKSVTLNGVPLPKANGYRIDRSFECHPASDLVRLGTNKLVMHIDYFQREYVYYVLYGGVSESLRNCLNFDTEIEIPYLFGSFCVECNGSFEDVYHDYHVYDGDFTITKQHEPADWSNIVKCGYPFFNGMFEFEIEHDGCGNELYLHGYYPTAEVSVNGTSVKKLMFTNHCDLSEYVSSENDRITVKVWGSHRNLLGPHHCLDAECIAAPDNFSMEKEWDGDNCPKYKHTYSFKRFGIKI